MKNRGVWSLLGPAGGYGALIILTIWLAEGPMGFRPFLNLEALLLVLCGTLACLQIAYPLRQVAETVLLCARGIPANDEDEERRRCALLRHGADSAMGMGGAATILGMILLLSSVADVSAVPRRMALCLTAMFYGMVLSEGFFMPLSRRVRRPDLRLTLGADGGGRRRFLVGLGAGGGTMTCFFIILYALSAALKQG